jgi:hypothetical protein
MEDKQYIKTPSIDIASTLLTLGYPIDGIYYSGVGETMDFYFTDTPETRNTIQRYHAKELRVEPSALLWSRKEIISRMKNETRTQKPDETGNKS